MAAPPESYSPQKNYVDDTNNCLKQCDAKHAFLIITAIGSREEVIASSSRVFVYSCSQLLNASFSPVINPRISVRRDKRFSILKQYVPFIDQNIPSCQLQDLC